MHDPNFANTAHRAFKVIDAQLDILASRQVETLILAPAADICRRRATEEVPEGVTFDAGRAEWAHRFLNVAASLQTMDAHEGVDNAASLIDLD